MSCGCGDNNRITIVRGNDTNFNGQNFVHFNITSDAWDLSTMKATIALGGITKTFEDLSNGIDLSYTAAETSKMPFGDINGVLKVYNQDEQIATIESLLPFRVISVVHGNAIAVTPAEFNIEVKQGGETVMNIDIEAGVSVEVDSTVTLPAGSQANVENVGTENHLRLKFEIPEGEKGEQGDEGPEGPAGKDGEDGKDAKINGVNTLTLYTSYGISLSQSGDTATISGKEITDVVDAISALIPAQATEQNQLADKNFVNSSIATNTANFIGTFNSVAELEAYSGPLTNNDYAFVVGTDTAGNTVYDRYKYTTATTPASWVFEYELNNSSFTADQWAAINSKATEAKIIQITTNQNAIGTLASLTTTAKTDLVSAINELDAGKQDNLPSQSGNNGKFLTTNGSDLSWSSVDALPAQSGQSGKFLTTNGSVASWNSLPVSSVTVNGTSVVSGGVAAITVPTQPSDIGAQPAGSYVTTDTQQTITNKKTVETSSWNGGLTLKRTTTGSSFVVFENSTNVLGGVGLSPSSVPISTDRTNQNAWAIVRGGAWNNPAVGNSTTPVYVDSNGMAQPCSGIALAPTVTTLANNSTVTLASNTIYNGGTLTAFTIQLPTGVDNSYTAEIDFTSGATATTFTYPASLKWIEGDNVVDQVFTPSANKRYICMIVYDGTQFVGTVRGVL